MSDFIITTKRLGLRLLDKIETQNLLSLKNEQILSNLEMSLNNELTAARLNYCLLHYAEQGLPAFGIYETASNNLIGHAGFSLLASGEIEMGYMLDKPYWGLGYACEALTALLDWAKTHIDTPYIIAYMPIQHLSSLQVLKHCGMEHYKDENVQGIPCSFYRIENMPSSS